MISRGRIGQRRDATRAAAADGCKAVTDCPRVFRLPNGRGQFLLSALHLSNCDKSANCNGLQMINLLDKTVPDENASPSLEHIETSGFSAIQTNYREYIKSKSEAEYAKAEYLYNWLDDVEGSNRLDRFRRCRTSAYFVRHIETGEVRVMANACHLRFCPACARAKANLIRHNLYQWGKDKSLKFLTLTLKHSSRPLNESISFLTRSFNKLRRLPIFRSAWRSGVWFLQVTYNAQKDEWHPHLHCLIDGGYIDHSTIRRHWRQVTHGSYIVDIRRVRDVRKAVNEVSRYVTKPVNLPDLPDSVLLDYYYHLRSKRTYGTFGGQGKPKLLVKSSAKTSKWQTVGSWYWVTSLASTDERAYQILQSWKEKKSLPEGVTIYDPFSDDEYLSYDST